MSTLLSERTFIQKAISLNAKRRFLKESEVALTSLTVYSKGYILALYDVYLRSSPYPISRSNCSISGPTEAHVPSPSSTGY